MLSPPLSNFNPRPPRGGRQKSVIVLQQLFAFQSTSPAWGTTSYPLKGFRYAFYFNPRPPRGGRRRQAHKELYAREISIHVPRVGDDPHNTELFQLVFQISIHVPRVGDDERRSLSVLLLYHFNPRPPRGGRPTRATARMRASNFNPRPPRGGRHADIAWDSFSFTFQSTSPAWGTTYPDVDTAGLCPISIHVPRVGDDTIAFPRAVLSTNFNPRPPRGGRPAHTTLSRYSFTFQSTSPAWGTTCSAIRCLCPKRYFNPRPPRGGRRELVMYHNIKHIISIHVPRVGDDNGSSS